MSKVVAAAPPSPLRAFWLKWRFHINVLLLLIPLGFMPKYFADAALFRGDSGIGERVAGDVQVGPWSLTLAEFRNEGPSPDPAGPMKFFNAALCDTCAEQVKATYLRIGKPRSLRAAGVIFFGTRSEEHTSELQSRCEISYAVFCLKKCFFMVITIYCINACESYL